MGGGIRIRHHWEKVYVYMIILGISLAFIIFKLPMVSGLARKKQEILTDLFAIVNLLSYQKSYYDIQSRNWTRLLTNDEDDKIHPF